MANPAGVTEVPVGCVERTLYNDMLPHTSLYVKLGGPEIQAQAVCGTLFCDALFPRSIHRFGLPECAIEARIAEVEDSAVVGIVKITDVG